jgi:transposase
MYSIDVPNKIAELFGDDPQLTIVHALELLQEMRSLEAEFGRITFQQEIDRATIEDLRDLFRLMHGQAKYSSKERHLLEVKISELQDKLDETERQLAEARVLRSDAVFEMLDNLAGEIEAIAPFPYPKTFMRSLKEDGIKVFPVKNYD